MPGILARRDFLTALGGTAAASGLSGATAPLPIEAVELFRVRGRRPQTPGVNAQHQAQMNHFYEELRPKPYADRSGVTPQVLPTSQIYLRIRAGGVEGLYGPVDSEAALVIDQQLRRFLLGKDALAGDILWDQMYRQNRHARVGHMMMAISAIDNTLWDLRGRYFKTPVYRLMGGPGRNQVEVYASCLGYSVAPGQAAKKAAELKAQGFRHQKWFLAYGPGDGLDGLKKNVNLARELREAVGDGTELMFDAFMGWSLDYAIAWCKQVEPLRPRWIEEAFPPDKLEAFVQLRKSTSVPVATGEHFYNRYEAARFLAAGAISVVQADPEWCGGASEVARICTLASVHDAVVVPHGHSIWSALHVVASQPPSTCPLVEFLLTKIPGYSWFEKNPPVPVNGKLELPDRPGFGIELDPAKVEAQEPFRAA
jgi:L-alanine-DL-glutamate epimerase-like enolase superfamily enzyme